MSLIVDLIFIAIILFCIISGVKKGFIRSVMNLVTFAAAFICAWQFTPYLADYYSERIFIPSITEKVSALITSIINNGSGTLGLDNLFADKPEAFIDITRRFGSDLPSLENYYGGQTAVDSFNLTEKISAFIATPVAKSISSVLAFITIFAGVTLLFIIATFVLDAIFKLPILSTLNRFLGLLLGLVCGALNVWVISLVIEALAGSLAAVYPDYFNVSIANNSVLFNIFREYNPIRMFGHYFDFNI